MEAKRFAADDVDIVLIGHEGHEEVVGTTGQAPEHIHLVDGVEEAAQVVVRDPSKVAYLSQTTLSVDETNVTVEALRQRFPLLQGPPSADICYATQNRQVAVKEIAARVRPACWSSARATAPTPCGSSRWRSTPAPVRPTWSTTPPRSTSAGSTASRRSGSRAARRCPRRWCRQVMAWLAERGYGEVDRGRVGAGAPAVRAAARAAPRPAQGRHRRVLSRDRRLSPGGRRRAAGTAAASSGSRTRAPARRARRRWPARAPAPAGTSRCVPSPRTPRRSAPAAA